MPKLEIGPDLWPHEGYDKLDILSRPGLPYELTHVCPAWGPIPVPDGHYEEILVYHVIEHLECDGTDDSQVDRAMREWLRILRPGGLLRVTTPDAVDVMTSYLKQSDPKLRWEIQRIFYGVGLQDWRLGHKLCFDHETLFLRLQKNGFSGIRKIQHERDRHDEGWTYTGVQAMSLKMEAFKP